MRILGISGSLRRGSTNSGLLIAAAEHARAQHEFDIWDGLAALPPYIEDHDVDPAPASVQDLRDAIAAVDAVLFATPEYNSSIPGALKNAVDWASRPFPDNALRGKPVAVVGASSGGMAAMIAQADLRKVLARTGARVLENGAGLPYAPDAFDEDGRLSDDGFRRRLGAVVDALAEAAEASLAVSAA